MQEFEHQALNLDEDKSTIKPGKYQHYKGNYYEVLYIGRHSENLEEFVVYKALYDSPDAQKSEISGTAKSGFGKGAIWVRPKEMFIENIIIDGKEVPRFRFVEEVTEENRPKVCVGVIVIKNGKVLLQKRKNALGEGSWSFPGGHLEFNESFSECAKRETSEELGIDIKNARYAATTNDIFANEGKHYITVYMITDEYSGEPKIMEPDKCEQFGWFDWKNLPQPLFIPIQNLLKQGYNPF